MTEIFKCRKSGTKCCAPKSLIREALGHKEIDKIHQESTIQEPISTIMSTTTNQPITEFSSTSQYNFHNKFGHQITYLQAE